ncbi:MAG: dienelactone hydrolase family protein [Bacteroidia bacterium]
MENKYIIIGVIFLLVTAACNNSVISSPQVLNTSTPNSPIKERRVEIERISYYVDSFKMDGFVAIDKSTTKRRPAVLIIHEWWGLNNYVKNRVKQLAELGYVAFAIDLYGDGKVAVTPTDAKALAIPLYARPLIVKARFDAALTKIKTYPQVDTTNIAAIGYCFGGAMALNMARLGASLKGVVSFHGNLIGVPLNKSLLKAAILICHGEADNYVNGEVTTFKNEMNNAHVPYTFISYPNATHAFTNPSSTAVGKKFNMNVAYNGAADTASFNDMKKFFDKIFK